MSSSLVLIISQHLPTINHLTVLLKELGYQVLSSASFCFSQLERKNIRCILFPISDQCSHSLNLLQKITRIYPVPYLLVTTTVSPLLLEQIKQLPPPIYCVKMGNKDSLYANLELVKYQSHLTSQQKNSI